MSTKPTRTNQVFIKKYVLTPGCCADTVQGCTYIHRRMENDNDIASCGWTEGRTDDGEMT